MQLFREMNKLQRIINGWSNYISNENGEAESRAEVCSKCEHAIYGSYSKLMPDYSLTNIQGMKCNKCGCPLSTKLRAKEEECPLNKW